jgi:GDP-4-dehydro-6-deoxy-D-mannose reductase
VRKAIVIGSEGFVGRHLSDYLLANGWEAKGFNLRHGQNILNYEQVRNILDIERPDVIFHLAAQAYVPESFIDPKRAFEVNTIGSLNLLQAIRQLGLKTTVHLAGTSEEYGDGDVNEESKLQPKSPYAISKVAMDYLGQLYNNAYNMHVVVTRAFNHTGPGRGEQYAESSFAKQIIEAKMGRVTKVEHGNLESVRVYTDVRDIVRAYVMAIDLPSGVYNISSSRAVTMQQVMDILISKSGIEIETCINQSLCRPADFSFKVPDCKKFRDATGWEPEISLQDTLGDLLDYWQEKLS